MWWANQPASQIWKTKKKKAAGRGRCPPGLRFKVRAAGSSFLLLLLLLLLLPSLQKQQIYPTAEAPVRIDGPSQVGGPDMGPDAPRCAYFRKYKNYLFRKYKSLPHQILMKSIYYKGKRKEGGYPKKWDLTGKYKVNHIFYKQHDMILWSLRSFCHGRFVPNIA